MAYITPLALAALYAESLTKEKKKSLTQRQNQVVLAKKRGEQYIGEKQKS